VPVRIERLDNNTACRFRPAHRLVTVR
jgi:hypothetical protein